MVASVGVATATSGEADVVLHSAYTANQRARRRGRGQIALFDPTQPSGAGRLRLTSDLHRAVAAAQLRLYYQPVLSLHDGEPHGVEALLRWQHPQRGLLTPNHFLDTAEDSGLIVPIGEWVVREACDAAARWADAGHPASSLQVAVNLSGRQLSSPNTASVILEALSNAGVEPSKLVIEVTESAVIDDMGAGLRVLTALKDRGVRLALDDFGTGYSSLTYLKQFPFDIIKIDTSFVQGLGRDDDDTAIVTSVISLAEAIGVEVIAEGVETADQRDALLALGGEFAQGFLWSPALPADTLQAWLAEPRPTPEPSSPSRVRIPGQSRAEGTAQDLARITELHQQGASLHTIAAALNHEGRRTIDRRRWHSVSVARAMVALQNCHLPSQPPLP